MFYQLIYRSRYSARTAGLSSVVHDIVAASERNNSHDRVTGFLIFDKTYFMQVLEGEQAIVEKAYDRISQDPRHTELLILNSRLTDKRVFAEWSMGGAVRSPEIQHIFDKHGWPAAFEQSASGEQFIELVQDIAAWEMQRNQQRGLSTR